MTIRRKGKNGGVVGKRERDREKTRGKKQFDNWQMCFDEMIIEIDKNEKREIGQLKKKLKKKNETRKIRR